MAPKSNFTNIKKPNYIFILDDNIEFLIFLKKLIITHIPNAIVTMFTEPADLFTHPDLFKCDLFIMDIKLNESLSGFDVCDTLIKNCPCTLKRPFLFISGQPIEGSIPLHKCICDFVLKPFNNLVLINRIKLLLKVSETYEFFESERIKSLEIIWSVFKHSMALILILDEHLNIRLCNDKLAEFLGFKSPEELIGINWLQFIPEEERELLSIIKMRILEQKNSRENITNIISNSNKKVPIKWFNSTILNGESFILSIGVPMEKTDILDTNMSIDEIRHYWKNVIDSHKNMISALKDIVQKESNNNLEKVTNICQQS